MGSINSHEYPNHEIDQVVSIAETIYDKGITKIELLAEELGHSSPDGGAFRNKLTSLRRYGLISGRGEINLTELANRIVAPKPNSNEREAAIAEAILSVDLLKHLYERLDFEPSNDDFWYHLVEVTNADRNEAQEKSNDIRDLYDAGLRYVKADKRTHPKETNDQSQENPEHEEKPPSDSQIDKKSDISDEVDAILITPDARIEVRSKATFIAAKALFEEIGGEYDETVDE